MHRSCNIILILASIIGLLLPLEGLNANSAKLPSFDEAFRNSALVALVRIKHDDSRYADGSKCGTEYTGRLLNVIKEPRGRIARARGATIRFGRSEGLVVGRTYLLFLEQRSVTQELNRLATSSISTMPEVRRVIERVSLSKKIRFIQCAGLVPGLEYDNSLAPELQHGAFVVFGLWPKSDIPSSVRIEFHSGPQWLLRADDVLRYLQNLRKGPRP